jgi:hypothetical protein
MSFKDSDIQTHKPTDDTDPGFTLKGHKLRWVSGAVESRRSGRAWVPLKVSALPKEIVKKLQDSNPSWFREGDTIRRGDTVLNYAPIKEIEAKVRADKDQQKTNEGVFRGKAKVSGSDHIKTTDDTSIGHEVIPAESGAGKFAK